MTQRAVLAVLDAHEVTSRVRDGVLEAWEPATLVTARDGEVTRLDISAWVPVPTDLNGLADWLGY